jgi:methionyl aminopeptidase
MLSTQRGPCRSHQSARALLKSIQRNFGTLPFCRRYLDRAGEKNYLLAVSLTTEIPPMDKAEH